MPRSARKKSGTNYDNEDVDTLKIIANELMIAVQNALQFEEIERFNATLQERVSDVTRHLRRTNERLQQMDETKMTVSRCRATSSVYPSQASRDMSVWCWKEE